MTVSWSDVREVEAAVWPSPAAVLLAVLMLVGALWLGAELNADCGRWAQGDPQRLAACERLSR